MIKDGFKCQWCDKIFANARQLGGHTSRSHKGLSESYRKKCEVHESRRLQRAALKKAQQQLNINSRTLKCSADKKRLLELKMEFLRTMKLAEDVPDNSQ